MKAFPVEKTDCSKLFPKRACCKNGANKPAGIIGNNNVSNKPSLELGLRLNQKKNMVPTL